MCGGDWPIKKSYNAMRRLFTAKRSICSYAGIAALPRLSFVDSAAIAQGRQSKQQRKDASTCERSGALYDTPAYSDCEKQLRSLEESRTLSQLDKDGQIMAAL
jgi:hypothetical protein